MSRTKPFLFGLMLGAGLSFVGLRYHVVRYSEGFMLVPRTDQPPVRSAYADIRTWGAEMWKQYPEVAAALVSDGHGKLVAEAVTGDLLGQKDVSEADLFDFLPEERPATRSGTAGPATERSLSPIRLTPTGSERPTAPARPSRVSQSTPDTARQAAAPIIRPVPTETAEPVDQTAGRVRSALDSLFAPYDAAAKRTVPTANPAATNEAVNWKSSIPESAAPPAERILDLQDLDVDLGPARQVVPDTSIPHQARGRIFSPRRLVESSVEIALTPPEVSPATASSAGSSHQFPLK